MNDIVRLEERIAHQDHTIAQLDEVVREFTARIEALEREVGQLRKSVLQQDEVGPASDPPPHY